MLRAFCMGFLCTLVLTVNANDLFVYQVSLRTLKSDLDWIMQSSALPPIINIEYAGAVLSLKVIPERKGRGKYITIKGIVNIIGPNGYIKQKTDAVYKDGSFGLPDNLDKTGYIIIRPFAEERILPSFYIIRYISVRQLKADLQEEAKDLKDVQFYSTTHTVWPRFNIGLSTTSMEFSPHNELILIKKPLKGISLRGGGVSEDGCCGFLNAFIESDSSSTSDSSYENRKEFDVFFNVWYNPKRNVYGSKSGSTDWVDAVRVYDEESESIKKEVTEA